jgi:hypothetical protein
LIAPFFEVFFTRGCPFFLQFEYVVIIFAWHQFDQLPYNHWITPSPTTQSFCRFDSLVLSVVFG